MKQTRASHLNEEKLLRAIACLNRIVESQGVPRNVKVAIKESVRGLRSEEMELGLRVVNAVSDLETVSVDPCMPSFARVAMWSAVSELESIRA